MSPRSDKQSKLVELAVYQRKLLKLVGDLLQTADDLDQAAKYPKIPISSNWHERLATVCRDLAKLSQTVQALEKLIQAGDVKRSEDTLLRCTTIANQLSKSLGQIKQEAVLGSSSGDRPQHNGD